VLPACADQEARRQGRSDRAQASPDLYERMIGRFFAQLGEMRTAAFVFVDPFLGEFAGLDVLQNLLHRLAHLGSDHSFAPRQVTVFRRVADRITHVGQAAFVNQVDDQLDFMDAFKISHLRRITRVDQSIVTGLDQRAKPAAQNRLLAKQIGFRFIFKRRFDNRGASTTDGAGVSQSDFFLCRPMDLDASRANRARRGLFDTRCGPDGQAPWAQP